MIKALSITALPLTSLTVNFFPQWSNHKSEEGQTFYSALLFTCPEWQNRLRVESSSPVIISNGFDPVTSTFIPGSWGTCTLNAAVAGGVINPPSARRVVISSCRALLVTNSTISPHRLRAVVSSHICIRCPCRHRAVVTEEEALKKSTSGFIESDHCSIFHLSDQDAKAEVVVIAKVRWVILHQSNRYLCLNTFIFFSSSF